VRLTGMIVAPLYKAEDKPKNRASKSVPVRFKIAAYRWSSRFANVGDIRIHMGCQHFS
jgi:hypothetical protein